MTVFFTSDTHFGQRQALWMYKRPFTSVGEMDAALVANWNERVGPEDEVWHLGDFAINQPVERMEALLAALHGRKHLIAGNNDEEPTRTLARWASVRDYAEIEVEGVRLVLCHYAFRTWNDMGQGVINLHGHSHGRLTPASRQYDVGVDARDFRPVTLAELRVRRRKAKETK